MSILFFFFVIGLINSFLYWLLIRKKINISLYSILTRIAPTAFRIFLFGPAVFDSNFDFSHLNPDEIEAALERSYGAIRSGTLQEARDAAEVLRQIGNTDQSWAEFYDFESHYSELDERIASETPQVAQANTQQTAQGSQTNAPQASQSTPPSTQQNSQGS